MATVTQRQSAPLRLDKANEWVWQGEQRLQLTPKAFAVLRYLMEHPGRLVTKEEVLRAVWPDTVVSEWALTTCIRQIRRALGEEAGAPQYIATVHRRGYRFVAPIAATALPVQRSRFNVQGSNPPERPPTLPLPDKPSIAVLPFTNLSGDPAQEYFSDGLTEVLTSDLSKISSLFVIARHSAFTYKGKAVKVQDVGREMGVRYVLEGSVLKAGDQVRITAQLNDAMTGYHLWSERYDRALKDIFALQDEIVQKIVTTLKLQLTLWEQGILVRKTTDNLEAYDYFLHGTKYFNRLTKEANTQARQMFERAIELDPRYAAAYAEVGWTYSMDWGVQWSQDSQALDQTFELAQKAIALDDSLPSAHMLLGWAYLFKKQQHDQAIAEVERCIALDPNYDFGYAWLGGILNYAGRPEEAIGMAEKALRLNPRHPFFSLTVLGRAYSLTGRYEEAIATLKKSLNANPYYLPSYIILAAIYSELGREEEARAEAAEILRLNPNFSLEVHKQRSPIKDPAALERQLAALRKVGLK